LTKKFKISIIKYLQKIKREETMTLKEERFVGIYIYKCQKCDLRFESFDEFGKCPLCQEEIKLVEKRLERKEVVFVNCSKCQKVFPKEEKICPICGAETTAIIN
jgi:rRNA maturation endonuclease Nob1